MKFSLIGMSDELEGAVVKAILSEVDSANGIRVGSIPIRADGESS